MGIRNMLRGFVLFTCSGLPAAHSQNLVDRVQDAESKSSHLFEILHSLVDVYGPRLTGSPNDRAAAEWAVREMQTWGLSDVHLEYWNFGHEGWINDVAEGALLLPVHEQLSMKAVAWTPSTQGRVKADAVLIGPPRNVTAQELGQYLASVSERVKGKIVLVGSGTMVSGLYVPPLPRFDEQTVRGILTPRVFPITPEVRPGGVLKSVEWDRKVNQSLLAAGALVRVNDSRLPFREIRVQGNQDFDLSNAPPTIVISNDDYTRIARLLGDGVPVQLEVEIENSSYKPGVVEQNVVAEIPGTDKRQEVVLLGAHLDSWHGATGATDNGVGCAIMMEALRLLQELHLQPRRTIRVALFTGEEQGLFGSQAYVAEHYGTAEDPKASFFSLDAYLNIDSGSGRIRTVNVFGPPEDSAILRDLLAPLKSVGVEGAVAHQVRKLGSTDATTFSRAGLPGVGLTQDPLDYEDVTWHTNLDDMNHVDVKEAQIAVATVAVLAYRLAQLDQPLPRFSTKDMPPPQGPPPTVVPRK